MKRLAIMVTLLLVASLAGGMERSIIDREELSLKAGPTVPGEAVSLVWLEAFVYPKVVKQERVISLGVRTTNKIKAVSATFDFNQEQVALTSNDGLYWSGAYKIASNVAAGLHVVRYQIQGSHGSIKRTVEFFIDEQLSVSGQGQSVAMGEAVYSQSWPLTVTATCSALVGASSRILYTGEKLIGISKVPWYKVVFSDGEEGWVSAAMVKEPLEEYYQLGYEAYRNKKYKAAVEYYLTTIGIDPDFVKGHFWLAKSYYRQGDLDAAYSSVMEALRLDERNIQARILASNLARDYFETGRARARAKRHNEAVAALQKAVELKPSSALSWIELGKSYSQLGLPLEARDAWRQALAIEPCNRELHALLNISAPAAVAAAVQPKKVVQAKKPARPVLPQARNDMPAILADDSLEIVREAKTHKGTRIEAAINSVVALTKSLGTPVVEKGWQAKKKGDKFLVRYLCEQGAGALEAFEWLVDVDTKNVTAVNDNSRLLMDRW